MARPRKTIKTVMTKMKILEMTPKISERLKKSLVDNTLKRKCKRTIEPGAALHISHDLTYSRIIRRMAASIRMVMV